MYIRELKIRNFRGIKELDWIINSRTVCLIGPNNATKSTILDAIVLVASPWWNPTISDSDFYDTNVENSIEITASFAEFPDSLIDFDRFGNFQRGWNDSQGITDDPGDSNETVLSVRLTVCKSLEPDWQVVGCRDNKAIRVNDRKKLGVSRVGAIVDRDLSWGKGSALYRVTESLPGIVFSDLNRSVRAAVSAENFEELFNASKDVENMAREWGVRPKSTFRAAVDPEKFDINTGTLSLHDGNVPARLQGMGSKRLTALAMHKAVSAKGTILLIDEVEHGLEPFRLRQLVRNLRDATDTESVDKIGQVFFTTHSPIAVVESVASEWHVVRNESGRTTVSQVNDTQIGTVRAHAAALLSRSIIVCEGKTEIGLLRAMDKRWSDDDLGAGLAYFGVSIVEGGDISKAAKRSVHFTEMGYRVLLFADGDVDTDSDELKNKGIEVAIWNDGLNTEHRVFRDLPLDSVIPLLDEIVTNDASFLQTMGVKGLDIAELKRKLLDKQTETETRLQIAQCTVNRKTFKRIDYGEGLGRKISESIDNIPHTDLHRKLYRIKDWIYSQ